MDKFIDRKVQYPNRKKLIVKNVSYNEKGQIEELIVDEERSEGLIYQDGTKLDAQNMNDIIEKLCAIKVPYYVELEVIKSDLEEIEICENVDKDMLLPLIGGRGTEYSWSSSDTSTISINNQIAHVTQNIIATSVTLTVHAKYKSAEFEKGFIVFVEPRVATNSEIVNYDKEHLELMPMVQVDFELPEEGALGSTIQWTSSSENIVIDHGVAQVYQPYLDKVVQLIATITKGDVTSTKEIFVTVKGTIGKISNSLNLFWTKVKGSPKSQSYTITTNNNQALNIKVTTTSNLINIVETTKIGTTVSFTINENEEANMSNETGTNLITYTIQFLTKTTIIGEVEGTISYFGLPINPVD